MEIVNTYHYGMSRSVLMAGYENRCHMHSFLAEVAPSHKAECPGLRFFLARKETVTLTAHGCEGPLKTSCRLSTYAQSSPDFRRTMPTAATRSHTFT